MPPTKTAHKRFQPVFGQRNEGLMDRTEPSTRCDKDKPRSNRSKTALERPSRLVLKVKVPKCNPTLLLQMSKGGTASTKHAKNPSNEKVKTTESQEKQRANPVSTLADGDVFFFTPRSNSSASNEKEKAQLSVLRTISKMLEENQLIRERLTALNQGI